MTPINWYEFKRMLEAAEEYGVVDALLALIHDLSPAVDEGAAAHCLTEFQTGLFAAAVAAHEYLTESDQAGVIPRKVVV